MTHVFQPFNLDDIDINPFTKIGKEWALITAGNKEKYNTMTVSWGGMGILWGKKVAFLFIRDSRYTKEFIDNNDLLSISFLSEQYRDALNYCGTHSGRTENRNYKQPTTRAKQKSMYGTRSKRQNVTD